MAVGYGIDSEQYRDADFRAVARRRDSCFEKVMRCPVRFGAVVWVFTAESTPGREPSTVFLMESGYPDGASGMGRLPNRTCRGSVFAENFYLCGARRFARKNPDSELI
ncbi:MAG: hypothetical protein ACLR8Y_02965 [Alistipes indistinctus]